MTRQTIKQRIRKPEPNSAQLKAILNLQDDLLVAAGAGSGKTWVLTERYMEMLVHDTRPSQIVAITFTELAASEMKRRIRTAVQEMMEDATDQSTKTYWRHVYNELDTAIVSTIHGFCMRLLKEHPVEAGIDPLAQVLEPDEAERLLEEAVNELLEEALQQQYDELQPFYLAWGGRKGIVESLLQAYEAVRTFEYPIEQIVRDTEQTLVDMRTRIAELTDRIDTLVQAIIRPELGLLVADTKKKLPQYALKMDGWVHHWEQKASLLRSWDGTLEQEIRQTLRDLIKTLWGKYGSDPIKEAHEQIKQSLNQLVRLEIAPDTLHRVRMFGKLIESLSVRYKEKKDERYALDFHDLEGLTASMLEAHPQVADAYRKRLRYIMVDEFQDTNHLQKTIIDRIAGEQGQVKRFLVGDGKQSIYKFRGADVDVFQEVEEEYRLAELERLIDMGVNFRTQAGIIHYINDFFADLMQNGNGQHARQVRFAPLQAARNSGHGNPCVEILVHHVEEDADARDGEAEQIARRIRELVDGQTPIVYRKVKEERETGFPVQYGDIAILFSATTNLPVYEQALQRYGIPYRVEKGRQFYIKREIADLYVWLSAISDLTDDVALLALLRSPVFALSDETLFWLAQEGTIRENLDRLQQNTEAAENLTKPEMGKTGRGSRADTADTTVSVLVQLAQDWKERLGENEFVKAVDAARKLTEWQERCTVRPLVDCLRSMLEESGYLQILLAQFGGEQRYANVLKLLEIAGELQSKEGYGVEEFILYLKRMREDEVQETEAQLGGGSGSGGGAVRLMTVHASKGLEFPVVFLPDLKRPLKTSDTSRCLVRPGVGMGLKAERFGDSADDGKLDVQGDGLFLWMREQEKEREELEEQRKLYVAMTRARDYLVLAVTKPKIDLASWQKWIFSHLGCKFDELPSGTVEKGDPSKGTYQIVVNHEVSPVPADFANERKPWESWHQRLRANAGQPWELRHESGATDDLPVRAAETAPTGLNNPTLGEEVSDDGAAKGDVGPRAGLEDSDLLFAVGEPDSVRLAMLSASGYMAYRTCARRFYYRYLFQLPEPRKTDMEAPLAADDRLADSEEAVQIAQDGETGIPGGGAPVSAALTSQKRGDAHPRRLHSDVRGTLVHELFEHLRSPEEQTARIREHVQTLQGLPDTERHTLTEYLKKVTDRYLRSPWFRPDSHREQPFYMRLGQTLIHGFIDLVIPETDGTLTIVDFKTNEIHNREQLEELTEQYRVQLQLYALGAQAVFQKTVKRAILFFLDMDEATDVDVSEQALDRLIADLEQTCTRMTRGVTIEIYPMTEQFAACERCGYRTLCGRNEGVV